MISKTISIFELTLIILSSFSFAYFVSTDLPPVFEKENSIIQYLARPIIPIVSASSIIPSGCCKETLAGAICQEMTLADRLLCKTDLIGSGCEVISECQKGCCYDSDSGICSSNAPKEKCTSNGGEWDPSSTCNIPQCQIGCCILGDGATMMTTRECTQTANDYRIEKVFKPLDARGSCDSYSDPTDMGACLFKSDDFSNKKNCVFTTKSKCVSSGRDFKKDYLCTSKELNTTCVKTTKTSCIDGDDRVYFVDSCGNKANVYDAEKVEDDSYWDKIILPAESCSGSPEVCGNCDYLTGSICTKYISGKDLIKPDIGNYVCRNLNCANDKKHGESWCISDSNNVSIVGSAIGTRNYVASCFEGEIKIEGCADFNQEICIENKDESLVYGEAMCVINDWRSCIYANDFSDYHSIKKKCETLPQCIMFNNISGNEKYKFLPGFKENIPNDYQGRAGEVGKGMNKVIAHCVPRFTPGYQFWTTSISTNPLSGNVGIEISNADYGGSKEETDKLCGFGTFTCVSHIETTSPLVNPDRHDVENPECNLQAVDSSKQRVSVMMEALNERCRMLGSCGMQYNLQEELGISGFNVSRTYIDKKGKPSVYSSAGYTLSDKYFNDTILKNQDSINMGEIKTLTELTEFANSGVSLDYLMDGVSSDILSNYSAGKSRLQIAAQAFLSINSANNEDKSSVNKVVNTIGWLNIGVFFHEFIAKNIAGMVTKTMGLTPGESTAITGAITYMNNGLIFLAVYAMFSGVDNEYYVTEFKCQAWQPPLNGKCEECNSDVRPCSEFKCKSLGSNCKYFVENGEPGYCATLSDVWSAKISPWNEKLTPKNKYVNVSTSGFKIVSDEPNSKEVRAWKTLKFGIVTDDQAICKLDTNHSKRFDEMRYTMISDEDYTTGKVDGLHHWITLSPHVVIGDSEVDEGITTPPMKEGDNEYFIVCKNFAGTLNGAPFTVQVRQAEGPDLTPAEVTRVTPEDRSYLAFNTTNLTTWIYLDEPAECKYSVDYDYNTFSEMPNNFSCLTGKNQGFYGEWPCTATISNISKNTKIYIKCKDQPGLIETDVQKRNENRASYNYEFFTCQVGLKISSISPIGNVEVNSTKEVMLEVTTTGCINDGESECSYRLPYFGDAYSKFYNTGKNIHTQPLTTLGNGIQTINVECSDKAMNMANVSANFTIFYDDSSPKIARVYNEGERVVIETNEVANCAVNINETKQCDFEIAKTGVFATKHSLTMTDKTKQQKLYIRCEDSKGNKPSGCSEIIKLIDLKKNG